MYLIVGVVAVAIAGAASVFFFRRPPIPVFPPGQTGLDFTMKGLDGRDVNLRDYRGNVVMIVNVASKCGFTPQYEQLNEIFKEYRDRGFAILGFPANNFMRQEPGTDAEIAEFCRVNYGVEFDVFAKISVRGGDIAPLYAYLTSSKYNPDMAGSIKWNFTKFLLNRDGKVAARFGPSTKPDAPEVRRAIEQALAE